jgi:predicted aldo/keto reductase-like oxidoreductase
MNNDTLSRRAFLEQTALAAGTLVLASGVSGAVPTTQQSAATQLAARRTAIDQVTLGATGLKLSRLGIGLGSNNGAIQTAAGQEGLIKLVHYAYDQGITFIDTSKTYRTFGMIAAATKGLPREKLFIQSKLPDQPTDVLTEIDNHRKTFNTDYVDSMLIHCMAKNGWTDAWKRTMDGLDEAKSRKWVLSKGVSCHSLPALRTAIATDWTEVHLVRVNPQGIRTDGMEEVVWVNNGSPAHDIAPVLAELKNMKAKNRGVIGMKIMGNGEFPSDAEREKSVRFAMSLPELDAVIIGFKDTAEVDKGIKLINAALADAA